MGYVLAFVINLARLIGDSSIVDLLIELLPSYVHFFFINQVVLPFQKIEE